MGADCVASLETCGTVAQALPNRSAVDNSRCKRSQSRWGNDIILSLMGIEIQSVCVGNTRL